MSHKILNFLRDRAPQTPYLVVDLDVVEQRFRDWTSALPGVHLHYAVKANPSPPVLRRLHALGSRFDVASVAELDLAIAAGARPDTVSFGNTIKKAADVARAFERGVRLFATDSVADVDAIALAAPGAEVFVRLLTTGHGADWPLTRKFGCDPAIAADLLIRAAARGLRPAGVSFHVGSQQHDPDAWDPPLAAAARVFRTVAERSGLALDLVNIGGGFPAHLLEPTAPPDRYGAAITAALRRHFPGRRLRLIAEPGRALVADAGLIESEVVLISRKGDGDDRRWVFLDIGLFNGLTETLEEAIRYRIETPRRGPTSPVILAGPTCDSADVLYDKAGYVLPDALKIGDRIRIWSTGAYTSSYSSVAFNGIEPLRSYVV
jgi:ornithine decarboxylase